MDARKRIVKDILDIWKGKDINNNNEYIPTSLIIKSFKITGISNSLDETEDYLFDGYEVINNMNIINEQKKENQNLRGVQDIQDDINADKYSINEAYENENFSFNNNNIDSEDKENKDEDEHIDDDYEYYN